ncbi:hypothetical protein J2T08_005689 [Neorhizobium galegae]|uniref:tripartite tricarboxylate transporter TctB family protein n=1 Tax=Neorhizobium galegae TaxID=399 RepID=UPI002782460D|nr:tripartite tricarboxylate transporter TctB family protein [Neorhizobium galegae]MDQ0137745.1 hypothetical protein [Neorhizobium galegae]
MNVVSLRMSVEAAFLIVIAAICAVLAFLAFGYGPSRDGLPGPGLYPLIVASVAGFFALAEGLRCFIQSRHEAPPAVPPVPDPEEEPEEWSMLGIDWLKIAIYAAALIVQAIGMAIGHFFAAAFIAIALQLSIAEKRSLNSTIMVAVVLLTCSYMLFVWLLGVALSI